MLSQKFKKRSFEGKYPYLLPRKTDSINYLIFGHCHSILQGGPGCYFRQSWVYDMISGMDDSDHLITVISKDQIPLNAGTGDYRICESN